MRIGAPIRISKIRRVQLKKIKVTKLETYDEIIGRLLKNHHRIIRVKRKRGKK